MRKHTSPKKGQSSEDLTLPGDAILLRLRCSLPTEVGRALNERLTKVGFKWKPSIGWEIPLGDLLGKKGE